MYGEHDVIQALAWVTGLVGTGLIGTLIYIAKSLFRRLDAQDNRAIRLERLFTHEIRGFDRRITRVEVRLGLPSPDVQPLPDDPSLSDN